LVSTIYNIQELRIVTVWQGFEILLTQNDIIKLLVRPGLI